MNNLDYIDKAVMIIADNVLKHRIQRDGFSFDDECWLEDYAKARKIIEDEVDRLLEEQRNILLEP